MAGSKPKQIPQWQRQGAARNPPSNPTNFDTSPSSEGGNEQRKELVDLASEWLKHEDIKDESIEHKTSFLRNKGLTKEETYELLRVSQDTSKDTETEEDTQPEISTLSSSSHSSHTPPSTWIPQPAEPPPVAPIITYPEFLVHSHRPPPLITRSRVLSTLYIYSAAAAAVYGTSKYLLSPMLNSLNVARHSIFDTTSTNLENLNQKLESVVSMIPVSASKPKHGDFGLGSDFDVDDLESDVSDPTEMFYRDTGTQTSPPISRSYSSASLTDSNPSSIAPLSTQIMELKSLNTNLLSVLSSNTSAVEEDEATLSCIRDTREYLVKMTYGREPGSIGGDAQKPSADDEISRVSAEIRSVKGVLLSAKNFPGTSTGKMKAVSS
ncbi:hypothetical protein MMC26_002778 [Xylographa opegraphella]|nr:hypothetical protein [Xylographa opegraphella]